MRVIITPQGREPSELVLPSPDLVTFEEAAAGGFTIAEVPAVLSRRDRDALLDARVEIQPAYGAPWIGTVGGVGEPVGGISSIHCRGGQDALSRIIRAVIYAKTDIFGELKDYNGTNWGAFRRSNSNGVLNIGQSPNTSCNAADMAGYYYWGDVPLESVVFDAAVAHADVSAKTYKSATEGAATTMVKDNTSTASDQVADLDSAYGFVFTCYMDATPSTPSRYDKYVTYSGVTLYGTTLASLAASTVIRDIVSQLDTTVLASRIGPSDPAFLSHIETVATVLDPWGDFKTGARLSDQVTAALKYIQADFGFWSRIIGGLYDVVPVLAPWSTDPAYQLTLTPQQSASLSGDDIEPMATQIVVGFRDAGGRERFTRVTDTDKSRYLPALARRKDITISVDTQSETLAIAAGNRAKALASQVQLSGTIPVTGPLHTIGGRQLWPSELVAGKWVLLHNTARGSVPVRISHVRKVGDTSAEITVSNSPATLEAELARLQGL